MKDYQTEFLDFAIDCGVLRFGQFTLKSGRVSPYFFNTGLFDTGGKLARLAKFYAQAIMESGVPFDMLYGPAYKGIPLAAATAVVFAEQFKRDLPYAFNRKEAKRYAEGGVIVGHPLQGRVLMLDDVISAGTSVQESVEIIRSAGATPAGVAIALDRQERGGGKTAPAFVPAGTASRSALPPSMAVGGRLSAVQEVEQEFGFKVVSIANLDALLRYLHTKGDDSRAHFNAIDAYRRQYGT